MKTVTISMSCPPSKNKDCRNWRAEIGRKAKYMQKEDWALIFEMQKWPKDLLAILPAKYAKWQGHVQVKGLRDWDNLVWLFKWPIDILVHREIIIDDNPKVLVPKGWPTQEVVPRITSNAKLFITLDLYEPTDNEIKDLEERHETQS